MFNILDFGAKRDDEGDDTGAIQAALNAARDAGGGIVEVPAGTFVIGPTAQFKAIQVASNTWLRGVGPASVLRVRPGTGNYLSLFSSGPTPSTHVENIRFSDLRVDQNCGQSRGDVWNGKDGQRFAVFLFYDAANVTIERVEFDPVCGVNTVDVNGYAVRDVTVRNCRFRFAKGPTTHPEGEYDNTSVYLHGSRLAAVANLFEAPIREGARGSIELHGSKGVAEANVSRGFRSCVRVMGTSTPEDAIPARNEFSVVDNACFDTNDAINVWAATRHGIRGVVIARNHITVANAQHALGAHRAISLTWDAVSGQLDGAFDDVRIIGNTISFEDEGARQYRGYLTSGGILLQSGGSISNCVVSGNFVQGAPSQGIRVHAQGSGSIASAIRIESNLVTDSGRNPIAGDYRSGIALGGTLRDVVVSGNLMLQPKDRRNGWAAIRTERGAGPGGVTTIDNAVQPFDADVAARRAPRN